MLLMGRLLLHLLILRCRERGASRLHLHLARQLFNLRQLRPDPLPLVTLRLQLILRNLRPALPLEKGLTNRGTRSPQNLLVIQLLWPPMFRGILPRLLQPLLVQPLVQVLTLSIIMKLLLLLLLLLQLLRQVLLRPRPRPRR